MFNPQKLLGGLLRSGMGGGKRSGFVTDGMAMGLLGVAIEAFEHFSDRTKVPSADPSPGKELGPAPPPPPPGAGVPMPPPPPASGGPPPFPPVESARQAAPVGQSEAVLLIRAMIAAANADGLIDEQERAAILDKLQAVELSSEERTFIHEELQTPRNLDDIVGQATTREIARQVYMASLMAIYVDNDAERSYLQTLAQRLNLDTAIIDDIHRQMKIADL